MSRPALAALPGRLGRVAVLLGGGSAEREVSLMSGRRVLEALRARGVDVHGLDPRDDGLKTLCEGCFDRCFIALHGRGGEDGCIQGFLDTLGIPYTGSGVLGSALALDKLATKRIWRACGLPTPEWIALEAGEEPPRDLFERLGGDFAVKPAREGSTIGLSRVRKRSGLQVALELAFRFDRLVLLESWVEGVELTASILGGRALPLVRIRPALDFYDYEAKYLSPVTAYDCPSGLDEDEESLLRRLCLQAFRSVGASGWGRVDLLRDLQGRPWLLEANTVPGMTAHSLVPMAAGASGIDFESLVLEILAQTLDDGGREHGG